MNAFGQFRADGKVFSKLNDSEIFLYKDEKKWGNTRELHRGVPFMVNTCKTRHGYILTEYKNDHQIGFIARHERNSSRSRYSMQYSGTENNMQHSHMTVT